MFRNAAHALVALLLAAAVTAAPQQSAQASQGEHALSGGLFYAGLVAQDEGTPDLHGAGLTVAYRYGLSDFFTFTCDASYAPLFSGEELEHLGLVRAGITYTIDALEWVPWLGAQAVLFVGSGDERVDQGIAAGLGVDYRPQRRWSVGVEAWYHAMLDQFDTFPALLTVGLRASWFPSEWGE